MNILLTTDVFPPYCGGSGWSTYFLAKGLQKQGHNIKVITYQQGHKKIVEDKYNGIDVIRIGRKLQSDPVSRLLEKKKSGTRFISQIKKSLKSDDIEIVHAAHMLSGLFTRSALDGKDIPYVITIRDYWPVCLYSTMISQGKPCRNCNSDTMKDCYASYNTKYGSLSSVIYGMIKKEMENRARVLKEAALAGFVSEYLMKKVKSKIEGVNAEVIPNGLDFDHIAAVLSEDPQIRFKSDYAVFIGKLEPYKGTDLLVELLENPKFKTPVVVIGEGMELEKIIATAEKNKKRAVFLGWTPNEEVLRIVKGAKLLLFPSVWDEPLSRVLLEASALGVPAVAMKTGGTPELIKNNSNGVLVNKPEDFARTVVRILNKTEKISEMKKNQITSAKQNFNQETIAGKWQEIYKQVINEGQKQD